MKRVRAIQYFQAIGRLAAPMLALATCALMSACAQQHGQRFDTASDAMEAFVLAMRSGDRAQLETILGPEADEVLYSGDDVADQQAMSDFVASYDARHQLVGESDDLYTLVVGENEWPMPIPVVSEPGDGWYFDVAAGKDELLNRRIGRNELSTMQACLAVVDAQREYAERDADGNGANDYAMKFFSDPGTKNGLYWETAADERPSPLGDLVGAAADEGYSRKSGDAPQPYHGYYYRILTERGPYAPGGSGSYLVDGVLTDGFGIVAWPADYGNSGIMTFIISDAGVLYERDLGSNTDGIARDMKQYNPDSDWLVSDVEGLTALSLE